MKLSVLMPVYNEAGTIGAAVKRVLDVEYPCEVEIIVIDDGSTDATSKVLDSFDDRRLVRAEHRRNAGKGAALRTGARLATGDYLTICDADLEYEPSEIVKLLTPVLDNEAQVVFGTRTFGSHTAFSFWYVVGNLMVTMFANLLFNSWLSDIETCFKLMPVSLYRSLDLVEDGFGIEPEVTGKLLKRGIRPYEVPISYRARSRDEGKKLTWRDGLQALWILSRVRFLSRARSRGALSST